MYRTIKNWLLVLAVAVAPNVLAHAQKADDITDIREEFKRINTAKVEKKEFTYDSSGCVDGGVIQYFMENSKIVKVIESGAIGDGSWVREFYYKDGSFIFSYEVNIGGPANGPEQRDEVRIYARNGQVVKYIKNQKVLPADGTVKNTPNIAKRLLTAYFKKDFAAVLCDY